MLKFPPGQDAIDPDFLGILTRAAEAYGQPLTLTSGRQGRPTTPGSMHPQGLAGDVDMGGLDDAARARLVETLRAQGARRFGTYTNHPNMLHVDMSNAQGGNWYMHDKTNRKLANAPDWFRAVAGQPAPDVRQASAPGGVSTDTDRTPTGDPMTGLMDMQQTPMPPFPQMAPVEAPPESAPSMLELLALTAAGMAMGGGKGLSGALTGAGLAGGALRQQLTADQELWDLKQKRSDLMRKRQKQSALDEYAQTLSQTPGFERAGAMMQMDPEMGAQYLGQMQTAQQTMALRQQQAAALDAVGKTQEAALVRAGMTPGTVPMKEPGSDAAKYGVQPQLIQMPDGTTAERVYATDGTFIDRPLPGTPARYDPTVAGNVAQAQAGGRTTGEAVAKSQLELPETLATADRSLAVVNTLLNHPGREWAVGWQGTTPAIAGTRQADYIMKLEQLGGANFLQAFEALKGGGQITEVEGAKATKAISDLDRRQSDEEHRKSLETLKTIFQAARARAMTKAGRAAPQEPMQVTPATPPSATGGWKIEKE